MTKTYSSVKLNIITVFYFAILFTLDALPAKKKVVHTLAWVINLSTSRQEPQQQPGLIIKLLITEPAVIVYEDWGVPYMKI